MRTLFRATSRTSLVLLVLITVHISAVSAAATGTVNVAPWRWPLSGVHTVVEPFRAPAHEYGAGHRGVDLSSSLHATVTAPADGVVAFRGTVVDRPLLTIQHANGLISTFEPLRSALDPGEAVSVGQEIGSVDVGGHTPSGALHVGARRDGMYINPMLLFGDLPQAVLLPCCDQQ